MAKYYEVVFYGEVKNGKDLSQVKQLLAQSAGRKAEEIDKFYAEPRVILKKCATYEHAKKYAELFEKVGAQIQIETKGEDKNERPDNNSKTIDKKQTAPISGAFSSPRKLFSGLILMIMGGGIGFWVWLWDGEEAQARLWRLIVR